MSQGSGSKESGYSVQKALELPAFPTFSLNHEHAHHFRKMKMDAQTRQAYNRDAQEVTRTIRVHCKLCAVTHELKLCKHAAGFRPEQLSAEEQHSLL